MKIEELPVAAKKVLVRVDFNVPMNENQELTDDTRILSALPTICYLIEKGAAVILMSHLGRPKGKKDPHLSLFPCAKRLEELLGKEVLFADDCIGENVQKLASSLQPQQILLLENLRFHAAEEKPEINPAFAKRLASLSDFYINDAFGSAHRRHSSTFTITQHFLGKSAAGFLLEKEIEFLGKHLNHPQHPFYALIGGAKISSKLGVLTSLMEKVDAFFIGGGMAYTFLKAKGCAIGRSLCEDALLDQAEKFLKEADKKKVSVFLPEDILIADQFSNKANRRIVTTIEGISPDWEGMDIGPKTISHWEKRLEDGQMIFWNGPLGVFEFPQFAKGTHAMARCLAALPATTIIGGGDSVAAINQLDLADKFSHISTGGGACLEYIEYGTLPGIEALELAN